MHTKGILLFFFVCKQLDYKVYHHFYFSAKDTAICQQILLANKGVSIYFPIGFAFFFLKKRD